MNPRPLAFWILSTALVAALAQAGPPAPSQQPPAPAPSSSQPGAPLPPLAAPPRAMVPLSPKDPASLTTLHHLLGEQKKVIDQEKAFLDSGNKQLQEWNAQIQGYSKIAQDEIQEIKKKENWGAEVEFNPQTEKFEKPLPAAGSDSAAKPASGNKP
jgi:hypothetical protein